MAKSWSQSRYHMMREYWKYFVKFQIRARGHHFQISKKSKIKRSPEPYILVLSYGYLTYIIVYVGKTDVDIVGFLP